MKTIDALRAMKVYNTHELLLRFDATQMPVACQYVPASLGNPVGGTQVWSPRFATDPKAHWTHATRKLFTGKRSVSMPAAVAWATTKYGITEWAADPTDPNTKISKAVRDAALAAVRDHLKGAAPHRGEAL